MSDTGNIPQAMIDATARALYNRSASFHGTDDWWARAVDEDRHPYRVEARAVLAAAFAECEVREKGADWKPQLGEVAWRVEAWPHNPGEHGEHYSSGCLPAADVVREFRSLADRIESDWAVVVTPAQEETANG